MGGVAGLGEQGAIVPNLGGVALYGSLRGRSFTGWVGVSGQTQSLVSFCLSSPQ